MLSPPATSRAGAEPWTDKTPASGQSSGPLASLPRNLKAKVEQCRTDEVRYRRVYYVTRFLFAVTAAVVSIMPIAVPEAPHHAPAIAGFVLILVWIVDRVWAPQQKYAKALTTRVITDSQLNKMEDPNGKYAAIADAVNANELAHIDALLGLQDIRAQIGTIAGQVLPTESRTEPATPDVAPMSVAPMSRKALHEALIAAKNKLDHETTRAFADISLLERTEAQRTRISELLAQFDLLHEVLHLPRDPQFGSEKMLKHLLALTHVDKDVKLRPDFVRQQLVETFKKLPEVADYKPPYVRDYLNAIVGMTFILERQTASQASLALPYLRKAQQSLASDFADHSVSSLENALGICHALKMREGELNERIANAIQAHRFFKAAAAHSTDSDQGVFEIAQYRRICNHIEWLVDVIALLAEAARAGDANVGGAVNEVWTYFSTDGNGANTRQTSLVADLLENAFDELVEGRRLAGGIESGIRRPAIFLSGALLAVAQHRYTSALSAEDRLPGCGRPLKRDKMVDAAQAVLFLQTAVKLWRDEVDDLAILRYLQGNPVILTWGPSWDPFWGSYKQIESSLENLER